MVKNNGCPGFFKVLAVEDREREGGLAWLMQRKPFVSAVLNGAARAGGMEH